MLMKNKYIVQIFREIEGGFLRAPDALMEFQVIFSAKSKDEAKKKAKSFFRKWKNEDAIVGCTYSHQHMSLTDFISVKEQQYKVIIK
jgi:hypothetical protein